jgi:hypothetical protein
MWKTFTFHSLFPQQNKTKIAPLSPFRDYPHFPIGGFPHIPLSTLKMWKCDKEAIFNGDKKI